MLRVLMLLLLLVAGPLRAEETAEDGGGDGMAALMQGLPDRLAKRLRDAPDRFVETAAGLILGYGTTEGIDAAGIDRFIAVERADARSAEMRRFLAADLDDDGAVTRDELAVITAAAAADRRGRLHIAFGRADGDGDGRISPAELRRQAQAAALKALSAAEADQLRSLLALDRNGNGRVTLAEVSQFADAVTDRRGRQGGDSGARATTGDAAKL